MTPRKIRIDVSRVCFDRGTQCREGTNSQAVEEYEYVLSARKRGKS